MRELKNPFILQLEAPLSLLHRFAFISDVSYYVARTLLSTVLVIHDRPFLGLFSRYSFYSQWIAMFLSNTRCFYRNSEKPVDPLTQHVKFCTWLRKTITIVFRGEVNFIDIYTRYFIIYIFLNYLIGHRVRCNFWYNNAKTL